MTDYLDPTRESFEAFKKLDRETPLNMLNLIRLHDRAAYPTDHPLAQEGLSGRDAYAKYGELSGPIFRRVGGAIIWRGQYESMLIGPQDEIWDIMFIAQYPNAHAFLEMATDPEYQRVVVHRQAAVKTSRLIRTQAETSTDFFG